MILKGRPCNLNQVALFSSLVRSIIMIREPVDNRVRVFLGVLSIFCLFVGYEYVSYHNDIGAIQKDWFSVDKLTTLRKHAEFIKQKGKFITEQLKFIKDKNIQIAVADIPALTFPVARKGLIRQQCQLR